MAGVVRRGDIVWADLPEPIGRRPVCVLTRDAVIPVLASLVCATITRTPRGTPTEVGVGSEHGLPAGSVINCDNLVTVPASRLDPEAAGHLDFWTRLEVDRTLAYSLDIRS